MAFDGLISKLKGLVRDKYADVVLANAMQGKRYVEVSFSDILQADPDLASMLLETPDDVLSALEVACHDIVQDANPKFRARICGLPRSEAVKIRDIRSQHIGRLVCIEGVVRSRGEVRPQATSARFECPSCGVVMNVLQIDMAFCEPHACSCGRKGRFRLISKELMDVQSVTLEEDVSEIGDDTTTKKLKILLKEDLTSPERSPDLVPPSSVRFVGVIKEAPIVMRSGKVSTKFDLVLEANNFEPIEDNLRRISFSKADVEAFREIAGRKDVIGDLRRSVAPHLCGMDVIKEAVLLFVVKGVRKVSPDGAVKCRDFFHILLIGDPGSGKSEFGKEVAKLSYKCKRAVGKGASGVGLTVSAEKDELLGERVLSAGTVPMCNGGHAVIDEVDKIEEEVQSHLLDCMEEGTISVSKSRVQGTVKAEVGIFTIANPKHGRFVLEDPLAKQINLILPLIGRFDLIFPVMDIPGEERDEKLVDAILGKHYDVEAVSARPIELQVLRKYLCYVSTRVKPKLSMDAVGLLREFALGLRRNGAAAGAVSITPRQIEGPVRLAEAYAKLRMSEAVERCDAERAVSMVRYCLDKFGYDKGAGVIDVDRIESGVGFGVRKGLSVVEGALAYLRDEYKNQVPVDELVRVCSEKGVTEEVVDEALVRMKKSGEAYCPRPGYVSLI